MDGRIPQELLMKILARDAQIILYRTGGVSISFDCSVRAKEALEELKNGDYVISIEKASGKRTLNQNALLWQLIGEIDRKQNGRRTTEEDEAIYEKILSAAGVHAEYLQGLPEMQKRLKEFFRVVEIVETRGRSVMFKCLIGVSSMNKEEMSQVIECALDYAEKVGIDRDAWRKEFE